MNIRHILSKKNSCWEEGDVELTKQYEDTLELTGESKQEFLGFGGCFNEISWDILKKLPTEKQDKFFDELYGKDGCAFNMGRVTMGANDYSLEWYSCNETKNDFEMKNFNIDRDKKYTIPYIKEAQKRCPDLYMFASPWSPPTWMKTKQVYNNGRIKMQDEILKAYALYYIKFVQAYKQEGISIDQIHIQNEPMADQKFPSCLWHGEDMRDFIKDYIGPELSKSGLDTELWVGTINGPFSDFMLPGLSSPFEEFYDQFANTILSDKEARKYIDGVGFQWGGKHVIEQVELSYPEIKLMQTENECGDGENTWQHAEYVFGLIWHYLHHGAERYAYWNMVLPKGGCSTWGWKQNSLATIDEETLELTYQPEFYFVKHFSHFVKKGAKILKTKGHWTSNSVAFENPDGEVVIVVASNMNNEREFTFKYREKSFSTIIEPHTIHTFTIK